VPVTIRPAVETDQATIRHLIKDANLNRMSLYWPNFLVAEDGAEIVGIGQVKEHRDGSRELASIAVVPARQGQGIADEVIEALLAREPGVLYLTCRSELENFYGRFGFTRIAPAEYPPYFRRIMALANLLMRVFGRQILVMRREASV